MTDNLDWLDEADRATLEKMMTEKADDIIADAIEKAEQKFEGVSLEQQENLDLFNEHVKEYGDIMLKAYTQRIEKLALADFEDDDGTIPLNFKGYPDKALFHTTSLSYDLPLLLEEIEDKPNEFHVKRRRDSNKIEDRIGSVTINELMEGNKNIDFIDVAHYLGVCRLYDDGTNMFTTEMLVRATYFDSKKRVTETQKEEAIKSITKLMTTIIDVDVTEDFKAYRLIEEGEELFMGEVVLHLRRNRLKHSNGTISWGYQILSQPPLDVIAFQLGQVDRLDSKIARVEGGKEDLLLTNYLSLRLATLKNEKNNMSNIILLETVFEHMDLKNPNRQKRAQIRNKIEGILIAWKGNKIIKGYEFKKENNQITKFVIVV